MTEDTNNPKEGNKNQNASTLVWFGFFFLLVGVTAFLKPVFYFRGGIVDFSGFNHLVGFGLFVFGLLSIVLGARRKKTP